MYPLTNTLLKTIYEQNELQKKFLDNSLSELSNIEKNELEQLISFFIHMDNSVEDQSNAYLTFINDVLIETKYFVENGHYRYNKLSQVANKVYNNPEYMNKYMIGLTLSNFLWPNHRNLIAWFEENINKIKAEYYLEIGPGYGQYFLKASKNNSIKHFDVVDLSETSLNGFQKLLEHNQINVDYTKYHENFLTFQPTKKYDVIVTGEVLEHVENPELFVQKMRNIINEKGQVFLTTAINAPAIDHIHLFESIESVVSLVESCGFKVSETHYVVGNGKPLEKAIKKKTAINISLLAKPI